MGYFFTNDINETFIIEPLSVTGGSPTITACTYVQTNAVISCSGDTEILLASGATYFNTDILPNNTGNLNVGTPVSRFRSINALSGTTTYWTATTSVTTGILDLGNDLDGNLRQITADNSIIQNDTLLGGTY